MSLIIIPAISVFCFFSLFYLWARVKDDYSVIDICWGLGFIAQATSLLAIHNDPSVGQIILSGLVILWASRLSSYIFIRNQKKGEDSRYTDIRKRYGKSAPLQFFFRVYMIQALLNLLIGSGLILTMQLDFIPIGIFSILGILVALFAIIYEGVADYQKNKFKKKNENLGKPCREGLWYYSRHPNYFGEMLFWWGIYLFAIPTEVAPYAWIGAFFICFFLLKLSGVNLLTEEYKKKESYQEYIESTNMLFPYPPKEKI